MYPVLFGLGPLVIATHGFFTTLGLLAELVVYYYELRRRDLLSWRIVGISVAAIFGGGIGARTITAWEHLPYYSNNAGAPLSYPIARSGKSIIGGLPCIRCYRSPSQAYVRAGRYSEALPAGLGVFRFLVEFVRANPEQVPASAHCPARLAC